MLFFCQDTQRTQASRQKNEYRDLLRSTRHVRVATAFLLFSFWLVWIIAVVALAFHYSLWAVETCLSSVECSLLSVIVLLLGVVLSVGTLGWICESPVLSAVLIVPPVTFAGAISTVLISLWILDSGSYFKYNLTVASTLCFFYFWLLIVYIVTIIRKYCKYLRDLKLIRRRNSFNIDVFKESFFGTPPLKGFDRMEFARCSTLSDSLLDDIFGDDYELDVLLE